MKIFRGTITTHLMAAYSSESEDAETLGTTLRAVAAEFKGKVRRKSSWSDTGVAL